MALSMKDKIKQWYLMKFKKQRTFIYCPRCHNELISSDSFVEDKDGIVKYKCTECGNVTFWDFIHFPIPYLRTCAGDCKHICFDDFMNPYCEQQCDPDTMIKFEQRTGGKKNGKKETIK